MVTGETRSCEGMGSDWREIGDSGNVSAVPEIDLEKISNTMESRTEQLVRFG